jgi:hypothetical protein
MWITPADSQVRHLASLTMDFDTLFQDLENQLEREFDAELINRIDDEERERRSKLTLRERLIALQRSHPGSVFHGTLTDGRQLRFVIKNVGKDWVALDVVEPASIRGAVIAALHAFVALHIPQENVEASLGTHFSLVTDHELHALSAPPRLAEKVNLAFVLRDLSRRRKQVELGLSNGSFAGTIDHVGVDHLDLSSGSSKSVYSLREVLLVQIH